jgi:molybdopterin molybdotransferase
MRDMLGRGRALGVAEALGRLLKALPDTLPSDETVPLHESYGRVLSADVVSSEDVPGFDRSSMDGYAVRAADTFGAGEGAPAYLKVVGDILMGEEPSFSLGDGEAAGVATGGMLPGGADAVLMHEHAEALGADMLEAQRALAPGENVIRRGEDVGRGETVLEKGRVLRPQDVSVLASLGVTGVGVYARPRVAIVSTGDEIVPPEKKLGPGLVRDSNSYNLAGMVLGEGGEPLRLGIVRDEEGLVRETVQRAAERSHMVLISGGSSVGARDLTERVVAELGEVIFHSVAMKPGKPLLAGLIAGRPVFGLPGHPRAVSVCFEQFVRPVLRRLAGRKPRPFEALSSVVRARLAKGVHSSPGRQENVPVALEDVGGELWATPLLGKSGLISMLVRADGTLTIPLRKAGYEKDELVEIRLP